MAERIAGTQNTRAEQASLEDVREHFRSKAAG